MKMIRHWAVPLAVLGGIVVVAALTSRKRDERRHETRREHSHQIQSWEGEGGNVDTPSVSAVPRSNGISL